MRKLTFIDICIIVAGIIVIAYSITGCAKKVVNEVDSAKLGISIPISASKLAAATDYGVLTITAADLDSAIVKEMMVVAGNLILVGDTMTVPTGPGRTFTIEGYMQIEGPPVLLYSGSQTIDVTPGLTYLNIELTPAVPMINLSPHFQEGFFFDVGILSDTFAIEVYAHGIDSLTSVTIETAWGNGPLYPLDSASVTIGSNLPDSAFIWNEGPEQFGLYMQGSEVDYLTDENGNAHLATLRFYTYNNEGPDTASIGFVTSISSIYGPSGQIFGVYPDDAEVLLIRIPIIVSSN